ncbi:hypothetical protein [Candidatus Cardinium hertigii]|uniref:Lipoprotein n=1 Tax=Candidatus Cardinium hertigii TaxID=247481 RepID=A0A2Z3LE51_9BACT|nr:hypothetical protein [Candidatus Cardinium hertigii]AWN82006.1 hypothetical protein DK880_00695 [Candidatus Cardinium hertigii]
MGNKIKMVRLWKFLIYYSFTLVLVGCENVRSGQLGMLPQSKKENSIHIFRSGDTKKAKYQNKTIIRFVIMLGLLSAQLTPVGSEPMHNSMTSTPDQMVKIKEIRTLLYKRFSTFLFATGDVDTTTLCSLEASNAIILQQCKNDCTDRLNKLLKNEKIKELMKRYNSTSNNNKTTLYERDNKIRIQKENGDNYPKFAFTYKKNGTIMFYGWRDIDIRSQNSSKIFQSIPDEINKIWETKSSNQTERIKQLKKLVALLMNRVFTNDSQISSKKQTVDKWCNNRNQDAAMGLIKAIEQIVDLIEIEEKLQKLKIISLNKERLCSIHKITNEHPVLLTKRRFLRSLLCDSYKKGFVTPNELEKSNCNKEEFQLSKSNKNGQQAQRKKRQTEERLTQRSKQNRRNSFLPHNTKQ